MPAPPPQVQTSPEGFKRSFEQQLSNIDYDLLKETFKAFDKDNSGEVDFEEFAEWWTSQQAGGGCAMRAGIHFCLATKAA